MTYVARTSRLPQPAYWVHLEARGGPTARSGDAAGDRARVPDELQASPGRAGVARKGEQDHRYALALAPRQMRRQAARGEQQRGPAGVIRRERIARRAASHREADGGVGEPRARDEPTGASLPHA